MRCHVICSLITGFRYAGSKISKRGRQNELYSLHFIPSSEMLNVAVPFAQSTETLFSVVYLGEYLAKNKNTANLIIFEAFRKYYGNICSLKTSLINTNDISD